MHDSSLLQEVGLDVATMGIELEVEADVHVLALCKGVHYVLEIETPENVCLFSLWFAFVYHLFTWVQGTVAVMKCIFGKAVQRAFELTS